MDNRQLKKTTLLPFLESSERGFEGHVENKDSVIVERTTHNNSQTCHPTVGLAMAHVPVSQINQVGTSAMGSPRRIRKSLHGPLKQSPSRQPHLIR